MKTTLQTLLATALLLVAGGLRADDPARFDLRMIAPGFDGEWAEIEVAEEPVVPVIPVAVVETPEEKVVVYRDLTPVEAATLRAAQARQSEGPEFAEDTIYPSGQAVVFGVTANQAADIVILDNGLDQGFRVGMLCEVFREEATVGTIVLVAVEADRAAGLIVNLQPGRVIRFGDTARIKTVQFS